MHDGTDDVTVSRRTLLRASAGTLTVTAIGTGQASAADGGAVARTGIDWRCPEATLEPTMRHCAGAEMDGCSNDHPATVELQSAVRETLADRYPNAGTLADDGYKPYFDTLEREDDGYSHWINPEYVADETVLDPDRPESVLVDDETWRSIGVMFIATRDGERVDPPPVYDEGSDERCAPWHYHVGLPGRFAWWYYRQAYERDFADGEITLPCRTPCMLHVWAVDHPEGVYAHDGPPPEYRDGTPAEEAGFETDAEPGADELGWDVLPDDLQPEYRPDELTALIPGL